MAAATTAVRSTEGTRQIVTITRGDAIIVRKGKAEVRKGYAGTAIDRATGKVCGFISIRPNGAGGGPWATGWEWVPIEGEPVKGQQ